MCYVVHEYTCILDSCRFVDYFYSSLEPLFTADPVLLYDFIYICRVGDYPSLFGKIPAYLSLARLSWASLGVQYFTYSDVSTYAYTHASSVISGYCIMLLH